MTDRIGTFSVDHSGWLARRCQPRSGKEYEHRAKLRTLEEVAHTIDELAGAPFTYTNIHDRMVAASGEDWPWTQIAVAVAFLKERGIITPVRGRLHVANDDACHLNAMIEYHALREEPEASGS